MASWRDCACAVPTPSETELPQSADYDRPFANGTPPEDGTVVEIPGPPDGSPGHGADIPTDAGPARSSERSRSGMLWWLSAVVVAVDQISKAVVHAKLAPFDSVTIIPGLLDFIHVQNAGVAFGFLNDAGMNRQLRSL